MKSALVAVALVLLASGPAYAEDGNVPRSALAALGLAELEPMSDDAGLAVRGKTSSFAMVVGTSVVFGQLLTPDTKNFVVGSDTNMVSGNAESTSALGTLIVKKDHFSAIELALAVSTPSFGDFGGALVGSAGGFGVAAAKP